MIDKRNAADSLISAERFRVDREDKWLRRFLDMARLVATWSKDPSTKVGAVIVDDRLRVVSTGFNGMARGVADLAERYSDRALKYPMIVHAEPNAIIGACTGLVGCTLVVSAMPCARCAALTIQSGIETVVYPVPTDERMQRSPWLEEAEMTRAMFSEAGVRIVEL